MIVHISPFDFSTGLIDESERLTNIKSVVIERDATDETSLLESATVEMDATNFNEGWYAVDALGEDARTRLGVFYFSISTVKQESDTSLVYELAGVSTLYNASIERVQSGYSVVKGESGTNALTKLLSVCEVPLEIEPFQIAKTQTYNGNVTKLGACWSILRSAGMCIQLSNNGTIQIFTPSETSIKTIENKSSNLLGEITVESDCVSYKSTLDGRPYDLVYLNLPMYGVNSYMRIASQSIDLTNSLIADEVVKREVYSDTGE